MGSTPAINGSDVPFKPAGDESVSGGQIFIMGRIDQRRNWLAITSLMQVTEEFPFPGAKRDRSLLGANGESGLKTPQRDRRQDRKMQVVAQGELLTKAEPLRQALARLLPNSSGVLFPTHCWQLPKEGVPIVDKNCQAYRW